jgi:phage baseplate assembly protein W
VSSDDAFIGTGWAFPPRFEKGSSVMSSGTGNIRESLRIITGTFLGERLMRPDFGCALDEELFGTMSSNRLTWIENLVRRAILLHEPRIDVTRLTVTAEQPEGRLMIDVRYVVRGSNSRFNVVFPFYLEEG